MRGHPGDKLKIIHRLLLGTLLAISVTNFAFGFLAFSPDGKCLSFSTADSVADNRYVIRIVAMEGGETRDLFQGKLENFARHVWTPDGKNILFIKRTAGTAKEEKRELWQVDSAGGEPKKINVGMDLREVRLHPEGRRIVFTSGKDSREIWVMENFLSAPKIAK
jgi:Tol biopolymer transport system component